MEITAQITSKISQAATVLIIVAGDSGDSLAAGLALQGFLKKLEKETAVLSFTPKLNKLDFLQGFREAREELDVTKSFVIDVSTKQTQIEELSYKKEVDKLSIFIKPKKGQFEKNDISFRSSNFPFDLLIMIGVDSLDRLGQLYNENTELFFETPILNIDFKATNENFGQYNLVNLTATSNSEIVFDLINHIEATFIDEAIATQLLTGIISETESFQHVRTTPQTFLKASQLVSLGANQQEIISRLYKTKSLGLLKLWGRVLARLQQAPEISLVYSSINQTDLERSQASEEDVQTIIKEMSMQLGFAKLFLFFKEDQSNQTSVWCHSTLPVDLRQIFAQFKPKLLAYQTTYFSLNQPLSEAEKQIVSLLKSDIAKYKLNM
ncbi:MAG: hypothetical protein A3B10_00110 [Candidatus Doudnabacteria bacterium RIFCSPLOWO2_01_FULL_44_21]|uniref:DDH domain-containing protein n=1 Tax=Candidatus Doudnabacteria bacterium RIFCSPLOWO2_01_FULL_44_21 TaxID=1817841 RepID=A0A1F5PX90_9BACT|nr:MAG: hypothetical protein A3B95_03565 [Candidatus Doudnabacteria bacterium RIFCSPHIGHO2_02_FULL_43_13b]OGE94551.1 MAG: hypothetical protein A3B10_00110 [Candidatus Doudnabacteria bacterium RIFCSPLOWO2_01_FULL_44_21]